MENLDRSYWIKHRSILAVAGLSGFLFVAWIVRMPGNNQKFILSFFPVFALLFSPFTLKNGGWPSLVGNLPDRTRKRIICGSLWHSESCKLVFRFCCWLCLCRWWMLAMESTNDIRGTYPKPMGRFPI